MKKITLLLCVIAFCCVNVVNAQVSKGKILLGATSFALGVPIGTSSA